MALTEPPHNLDTVFSKPMVIPVTSWSRSMPTGTELLNVKIPDILFNKSGPYAVQLSTFAYFASDFIVRIHINGTPFHQGKLLLVWHPLDAFLGMSPTPQLTDSEWTRTHGMLPSVLIDPVNNRDGELVIPYQTLVSFLTTSVGDPTDTVGTLRVIVYNQMQSSEGARDPIDIVLSIHAINSRLAIPIHQHTPLSFYENENIPKLPQAEGLFSDILNGGKEVFEGGLKLGYNIITGNIPNSITNGGRVVTGIGKMFGGEDKPSSTRADKTPYIFGELTHGLGISNGVWLSTIPHANHPYPPAVRGTTQDEMDLTQVITLPGYIGKFNFPSTAIRGQILHEDRVTPTTSAYTENIAARLNYIYPNWLSYVSTFYSYWRGDITYRFECVKSGFHTARLLIAWCPNEFETTPTLDQLMAFPNVIWDIENDSDSLEFTVKYNQNNPAKACRARKHDQHKFGVRTGDNFALNRLTNGIYYVAVYNTLSYSNNVANNIDINIYMSAVPGFEFSVPGIVGSQVDLPLTGEEELPEAEALSDQPNKVQQSTSEGATAMLGEGTLTPANNNMFDRREMHLAYYLKRGFRFCQDTVNAVTGWNRIAWVTPRDKRYPWDLSQDLTFDVQGYDNRQVTSLDRASKMYLFWVGSMKYYVLSSANRTDRILSRIYHVADPAAYESKALGGETPCQFHALTGDYNDHRHLMGNFNVTTCPQQPYFQVVAPHRTDYERFSLWLPQQDQQANDTWISGCKSGDVVIEFDSNSNMSFNIDYYKEPGDDFKFSYLLRPPIMTDVLPASEEDSFHFV